MKRDVVEYVSRCLTCQQVKVEHQRPRGLLQPLLIPQWKWEHVSIDFVIGLPSNYKTHDSIWVVIDRLTKFFHFLAMKVTDLVDQLARLYIKEVIRLHDISVLIILDRNSQFIFRF